MKILIIEDEPELRKVVQSSLEASAHRVEYAQDFPSGLRKIEDYSYDCILLDIMLPGGNGLDILKEIRNLHPETSVIILSAKDAVDDKVAGLDLGADDYLAKPFHLAELHSRINSALRRRLHKGEDHITYKNLAIYPEDRILKISGQEVSLNRKEYDMLYYFMVRPNKLLQKTTLAESIWGDNIDQADSLDFIYSQVKNLRKKLKDNHAEADLQAVYGVGYKLV
ncbi:MAG: response regulator transcription factor [Leadbetterella sp.]|nr:response regulator transcription factor [Leadbetterella sp.]